MGSIDRDQKDATMTDVQKLAQQILARLGELHAGKLPADRRTYPVEQLEDLARAVIAADAGDTLGGQGPLYVSLEAARAYGAVERVHNDETARRELTVLAHEARQTSDGLWRARRRATDLDITVRVMHERTATGLLLVVTHANVRPSNTGGRRG
jgi:hypothetical protein